MRVLLLIYNAFHILGHIPVKFHFFLGYGVYKAAITAMQGLTAQSFVGLSVHRIAYKRRADMRKMNPYLMSSAGFKLDFQKRV